ncbi:MAG: type IX secretion system membrane protein PorP/SprF [Cryomorphaceae bacterium]|nr:type IX secretion system membrane protein PorP/SprF [Cryomorphaceae bacterium]
MKKYYFAFILSGLFLTVFGQQEVQWSQYMFNKLYFNPAYAGMTDGTCISGFFRNQWAGFEGAPVTSNVNANIPVSFLGGGIGINVVNDQWGALNDVMLGVSYAYHINLGSGVLSIGIRGDLLNKSIASGKTYIAPDGTDGSGDESIITAGSDGINFDAGAGVFYQSEHFWLGGSSVMLAETSTEFSSGQGQITEFQGRRHYFLSAGFNFPIPNTNVTLSPNTLIKSDITKTTVDAGLIATVNNRFWAGASWRREDAMSILVGFYLTPQLRFGYSYDANVSPLRTENAGSHEVFVSYCFKIEIPPREPGMYRHPHYL